MMVSSFSIGFPASAILLQSLETSFVTAVFCPYRRPVVFRPYRCSREKRQNIHLNRLRHRDSDKDGYLIFSNHAFQSRYAHVLLRLEVWATVEAAECLWRSRLHVAFAIPCSEQPLNLSSFSRNAEQTL